MKYIIINIPSTLMRSWSRLSRTSLLVYLDNRRVFLFHFCDAVDAVTLWLWHRSHGQTKQGALNKQCKLEEITQTCLHISYKKLPKGRIQQWSCWSTASWTLEARRSQPGQRQLSRNQIHMLRFLSRVYHLTSLIFLQTFANKKVHSSHQSQESVSSRTNIQRRWQLEHTSVPDQVHPQSRRRSIQEQMNKNIVWNLDSPSTCKHWERMWRQK